MPMHTNDFGNMSTGELGGKMNTEGSKGSMMYQGMDIGAYVDFAAIYKLLQEALAKVPAGQMPQGASDWAATVVLHGPEMGSAWIMQHNPYKTWGW